MKFTYFFISLALFMLTYFANISKHSNLLLVNQSKTNYRLSTCILITDVVVSIPL